MVKGDEMLKVRLVAPLLVVGAVAGAALAAGGDRRQAPARREAAAAPRSTDDDRRRDPGDACVALVPRAARLLGALATLAFVATWILVLRPASLGGPASYVIVSGRSMEPMLHTGDLAVVRKRQQYQIGDLVAFRAEGGQVIHRIVGGDAETGYVTRGDNNDAPDIWRTSPSDIIGEEWFAVPYAGRGLVFFRRPGNFAIAMGALTALYLLALGSRRRPSDPAPAPPA